MSIYKKKQAQVLLKSGKIEQAGAIFKALVKKNAKDGESWMYLVSICAQLGDYVGAEKACLKLIKIAPNAAEPRIQLCHSYIRQSRLKAAVVSMYKALECHPGDPMMVYEMGKAMQQRYLYDEAIACYEKVVFLKPDFAQVYLSLGSIYKQRCNITKAIKLYRQAISIQPDFYLAHCDLVCAFNYTLDYSPEYVYQEHLKWGRQQSIAKRLKLAHSNAPVLDRKLRIAYVSPDLYVHSVAYFIEPLLKSHDSNNFEIFCYADERVTDEVTNRLKSYVGHWRSTQNLNHLQLAQLINKDKIDILVDLSGHTANSRLIVFTTKPAPIQISYLGYPNTTGVVEMDYRLTDSWADPENMTDKWYTEKLLRLQNCFLCYQPLSESIEVSASPVLDYGSITFGSFNNMAKITSALVKLWSKVLHAVPNSRLIIKNHALKNKETCDFYERLFESHGVSSDRISLRGSVSSIKEHMNTYGEIDIALDTFPYHGTTTSCEALWMGVPVITLAGETHVSRVGVSLLNQVDLGDLVAGDEDAYIKKAVELANNLPRLTQLRRTLRQTLLDSPLCDSVSFARNVENAYRKMWGIWCEDKNQ